MHLFKTKKLSFASSNKLVSLSSLLILSFLFLGVCVPLATLGYFSLSDASGNFVGFENFITYFSTNGLFAAFGNTVLVGLSVVVGSVGLSFALAYMLTHFKVFGSKFYYVAMMFPLFVPTVFPAIGVIYLFGEQGVFKFLFYNSSIYGFWGIFIAGVVSTLPHAFILLYSALSSIDHQLYYAAKTLGAGGAKRFFTITLPQSIYAIVTACLVVFIILITDIGIPKVLGGNYSVLSTEIFSQIIGLQNFNMGSAAAFVMLIPCSLAFLVEQWARQKQSKSKPSVFFYLGSERSFMSMLRVLVSFVISLIPLSALGIVVYGSFITLWPYDFSFTTEHYLMEMSFYGLAPFYNSLILGVFSAVFGTVIIFSGTYIFERYVRSCKLKASYQVLSVLPLGIPGVVLGVGFLLVVSNFLGSFQGVFFSFGLMIFYTILHFFSFCYFTAANGISKLSKDYESAALALGGSKLSVFFNIFLPLQKNVVCDIAFYLFVSGITSVSGIIFLYSVDSLPASVAIIQMLDSGNVSEASALGTMLFGIALVVRVLLITRKANHA